MKEVSFLSDYNFGAALGFAVSRQHHLVGFHCHTHRFLLLMEKLSFYGLVLKKKNPRATHLLHRKIISSQSCRIGSAFMFQFHQVPFFHWFNFNSSDFFPNLFVFSQSSSCLFNLHSLLVHTLRHTLMYAFQSPFIFVASCCTGPKKFFSTFNLSVTKKPNPCK